MHDVEILPSKHVSYAFRSILAGRDLLRTGLAWEVSSGRNISVFRDKWVPRVGSFGIFTPCPQNLKNISCSDIMSVGSRSWDIDKLQQIFLPGDIAAIMNVPIREAPLEDRMYWHFSEDGRYTEASGYVAQTLRSRGDDSSSAGHINRPILSKLAVLKVPKKCIFPIWRLWHGSLAVGAKFRERGMFVDASCYYCDGVSETTEHLFIHCPFAQKVWENLYELIFVPGWTLSMKDLLIKVLSDCSTQVCEIFVMTIRAIWRGRNDLRFNGNFVEAEEVRNYGLNHLLWYKEAQKVYGRVLNSEQGMDWKWKPPDLGTHMINCDAAYPSSSRFQGLGAVIRSNTGAFIAGRFCRRPRSRSVLLSELQAAWLGLQLAMDMQLRDLVLQTDSLTVVKLLQEGQVGKMYGDNAFAEMGAIINQCRRLVNSFNSVHFSFIPRSGNTLAHLFAQKGLVEDDMSFYSVMPEWAKDAFDVDLLGMTAHV